MTRHSFVTAQGSPMPARQPGLFWKSRQFTLRSRLTPDQIHERLSTVAPRFDGDTGEQISGLRFSERLSQYWLRVRERTFFITGPGSPRSFSALAVRASVEPAQNGSQVQLAVENGGPAVLFFFGLVEVALAICAIALDYLPALAFGSVCFIGAGILYAWALAVRARKSLEPLLACLERMLDGEIAGVS